MIRLSAYSILQKRRRMHLTLFLRYFSVFTILFFCSNESITGQTDQEYDEISVYLEIPRFGGLDIPAVIKGQELFLPVTDLFDFLRIRNAASANLDSVSGFFINPEVVYTISYPSNRIRFQDRFYVLSRGDLIRTETNLYLRSSVFGRIFSLDFIFNFRSLSVVLTSKLELPVIRELRIEEMRRNITRLKGDPVADTLVGRSYPGFRFGMADWSAVATEEIGGRTDVRLNLSLGAMIAGGEATASINYNNFDPFTEKQQQYLWRYVNNDFSPVRQVMAGKIYTNSTSSLFNPVIGAQITNTPTTFRRSFGTYKLSDKTEPGWTVELYNNNVLVDYVKADAFGFFSFDVPLVYGNSSVKLKFYGPWGEERTKEQNINIPYNFLPVNTLEYTVSAGMVEDSLHSFFSRGVASYGITRNITAGAGVEYLSSLTTSPAMPFVTSSFRITNNILLSAEYTYGVRARGAFSYRLPSNVQLDLNYTWYEKDQKAIYYNYREERKAVLSLPLKVGKFSSFQRFSVNQIVLPVSNYTTAEWLFTTSLFGVNTNITTSSLFTGNDKPYVYSNLSLSFRLPARIIAYPQVQYAYTNNLLLSSKIRFEKYFGDHAFMNLSYEHNFQNNLAMVELGFRYDFTFAQMGITVRQSNKTTSLVEYARGSLINDRRTHYLAGDNRTNVGRGGITIMPFVDYNSNGRRDKGEPAAAGLNIHTNGGRIIRNESDTTIRILGLEPYTNCFIELDPNSFENISWRLSKKTFSVVVDPEILKTLEVPVKVVGEADGTVTLAKDGKEEGIGRIILGFFRQNRSRVTKVLTEDDGYFSYFGFEPGKYFVRVDTSQLLRLGYYSDPDTIGFTITAGADGDMVSGLDFKLREHIKDTAGVRQVTKPEAPVVKKDTITTIIHEVTEELFTIAEDSYAVQLGAFRSRSNAEAYKNKLSEQLGKKVEIVVEGELFKVRVVDLKERADVESLIEVLKKNGISELWIITLKARKQEWRLVQKIDTVTTVKETTDDGSKVIPSDLVIQTGAFRNEKYAAAMQEKLAALSGKPIVVLFEDGYYKVRVSGFRDKQELVKMLPSFAAMGYKDVWVPKAIVLRETVNQDSVRIPVQERTLVIADTVAKPVEKKEEKVVEEKKEEELKAEEIKVEEKKVEEIKVEEKKEKVIIPVEQKVEEKKADDKKPEEIKPEVKRPTVYLRVGEFRKKSQALKAQRKISAKLDLESEILMDWESFYLLIPGFYTREETFPLYPELAGLGITKISVVQEK